MLVHSLEVHCEKSAAMRTTLDIDEDVLLAAKEMAQERNQSTGKALSQLAREA